MPTIRPRRPLADRFAEKVIPEPMSGCHLWVGSADEHGYGHIREGGKRCPVLKAHRVAYELAYGAIPDGLDVLHQCDNPACVNPRHLRVGTHLDNMREMKARGRERHPTGDDHYLRRRREQHLPQMRAHARRFLNAG